MSQPVVKDHAFYLKSATAGSMAAGLTHLVMVPVDVAKTRMQLSPAKYPSLALAMKLIVRDEGMRSLTLGVGPTGYGYLAQGFLKYGLYEVFKSNFAKITGQQFADQHSTVLYLAAGTSAEFIADMALTPFEAARIRMVSDPKFAAGTVGALKQIMGAEGIGGLYKGFIPLVTKQVPYTAVKFAVFEAAEDFIYHRLLASNRAEMPCSAQLVVTFTSGLVGGVVSAIASHPADTVLTRANVAKGNGIAAVLYNTVKQLGFAGLWAGILPRMGMVGILGACQLLIYDAAKVALFGLPTSQGIKSPHGQAFAATHPDIESSIE